MTFGSRDHHPRPSLLPRACASLLLGALLASCASQPAALGAPAPARQPSAVAASDAMLPAEYDPETGRVLLTIPRLGEDLLYLNTLAVGLGTAGLDRGQVGDDGVVRFERRGERILLIRDNTVHRAVGGDEAAQAAVRESFPTSVIASFEIEREGAGGVVIDATAFFLSDVYDVLGNLRSSGVGGARVDASRSYIDPEHTGSFPQNTEVRAVITYATDSPNAALRRHAPDGRWVTLEQHHSFVQLPETGLATREFDPRAGVNTNSFFDFSQPFDSDYRQRTAARWRLEPSDPEAYLRGELVEPVKPIVYYLDRGIPEPYRSAFLEGGNWWNEVFEAAGWRNAFRVELMPEGVDPMDARYPVLYWVHRQDRGPSVGPSYRDPRTGEILTTVVRMDSYRSLVDHDIYMGLLPAAGPDGLDMTAEEFAMARRRQHTAHEIGHTLGLAHNFAAASQGRSSVMDYPYPLIELDGEGEIDISRAFRTSGGAHDTLAIRYAYRWFPDAASEAAGLKEIVREAESRGLTFVTGGHASGSGSYPEATQWIEGETMLDALERTMAVRRLLIERFGARAAQTGEPLAVLNRRFSHVYLHHRYALHGATKAVGGMRFGYALAGEATVPTEIVSPAEQRQALELVLANLAAESLRIPSRVAALIPPVPFGYDSDLTAIPSPAGTAFDPISTAHMLAQEIVDNLLHPQRAARLVTFHAQDRQYPSLEEVLGALVQRTWGAAAAPVSDPQDPALRRVAQRAALDALLDLAGSEDATSDVRAVTEHALQQLRSSLDDAPAAAGAEAAGHRAAARRDIDRYFAGDDDPELRPRPEPVPLPWP
ncbi:MAG: zinc-dependent metalloprotease [Gemmatimonadota bacterium]